MLRRTSPSPLALLTPPYSRLHPLQISLKELRDRGRRPGSALVWCISDEGWRHGGRIVQRRPGGLSLLVVLPPSAQLVNRSGLTQELHHLRPHGVLPHHSDPAPSDLAQVLRQPPSDLAGAVTDYLRWRGIAIDRDTVHLVRRILDFSAELRSIAAVSRSMYISRRALGRRLTTRSLPVPSHWLQLGRLLRVAIRLQNSDATVSSVAFEHGYPDGFSLSNQMERLIGHRPSHVRKHLGWEWLVESWLRREAHGGFLKATLTQAGDRAEDPLAAAVTQRSRTAHGRRRTGRSTSA